MKHTFEQTLTRCREQLDAARKYAEVLGLAEQFASVIGDAERTEFRVSVLGRFKQGKSTVLNAILGKELLPTASLPCTSTLVEVRRAERTNFVEVDGDVRHHRSRSAFHEAVGSAEKGRTAKVTRWEVGLASEAIPHGLAFVDTPGTDEDDGRNAIARGELHRTDAALFVLGARQAGGLRELDDIEDLCERVPIVMVLVNQMDLIVVGDRARVLAHVRKRLNAVQIAPERVLPFSALDATRGDRVARAWLDDVRGELSEVLFKNTAGARLAALQGTVAQFIRKLEPKLDEAVARRERALTNEREQLSNSERATKELEAELAGIDKICKKHARAVSEKTATTMNEAWMHTLIRVHVRRSSWRSDENPLFSPRAFAEEIANGAQTELTRQVKYLVRTEIQPTIDAGLHAMRDEIEPQVPSMLALMGQIAPGMSTTKKFVDELLHDAMRDILFAVDSRAGDARELATAGAISNAVSLAVAQTVALLISGLLAGLVALPLLIGAALGVAALGLVMGRQWVVDHARDKVADVMVEKLGEPEVRRQVVSAVRDATRDTFLQFSKSFRANIGARINAARDRQRQHADRTTQRADEHSTALEAAKAARRELRAVERLLVREGERIERLRGTD